MIFWTLVILIFAFRIFLAFFLGISDDEAYYWEWSRYLSLSYYDHPPMIAWMIKPFTSVFGSSAGVIRLPAIISNMASSLFIYKLSLLMFREAKIAKMSLMLFLLVPVFSLGALLIVPDAPMSLFWTSSLYYSWKLSQKQKTSNWDWFLLSLLLGLGFLSKYTMILLAGSLFLFFLTQKRSEFLRRGIWVGLFLFLVCSLPIILWNAEQGWPSFKFHLMERQNSSGLSINRWLEYLVSQLGFITPFLFFFCLYTLYYSFKKINDVRWRFILLTSLPTLLLFSLQPLKASFKPHWPAPAYLMLFIGASYLFFGLRKPTRKIILALVLIFFIPLNLIFYTETLYPLAPKLYEQFSPEKSWNPKWDPTNDLYGAKDMEIFADKYTGYQLASWRLQVVSPWTLNTKRNVLRIGNLVKDQYQYISNRHIPNSDKPILYFVDNRYFRTPEQVGLKGCGESQNFSIYRQGIVAKVITYWKCPPPEKL